MIGIILAGGLGTRLHPLTLSLSKQLLPVYDKPMIYYPLSVLLSQSIKKIIIISTKRDLPAFRLLLGNGEKFGIKISYVCQNKPLGLVQAFTLTKNKIKNKTVCLILGDNIFYGPNLKKFISDSINTSIKKNIAINFSYRVHDPERYGVVSYNKRGEPIKIDEKPNKPKSNFALVGLYVFPPDVSKKSKLVKISKRGQLEITDLINIYLKENRLQINKFDEGYAWLDTGTHESLIEASNFIQTIEKRQGIKVGCLEEIAFKEGLISKEKLKSISKK